MPEEKKQRNQSMKWIKLGNGIAFDTLYFLADEKEIGQSEHAYSIGKLQSVTNTAKGKEYAFVTGYDKDEAKEIIETRFTHYCIPTIPV